MGRALASIAWGLILAAPAAGLPQAATTITVDPATTHQTMSGWEAVDFALNDSPQFPSFINAVLDGAVELGMNRVRLEIKSGAENTLDYWTLYKTGQIDYPTWRANRYATVNDNADPNTINPNGFQFAALDWNVDNIIIPLKNRLAAKGESLQINLCYVAFTGQISGGGQYLHNNAQEYAEFVLATNLHLQSRYGWVPDLWEVILEPDNVSQWSNGTVLGNAMVAAGNRLVASGITPRFVAPATTNMSNANAYFDAITGVAGALQYHEEIAYHRYAGVSLAALQGIANRAAANGKKTSMLEWWSGGNSYQVMHEDLKVGRNSAWQSGALAGDASGATDLMDVDLTVNPPTAAISNYAKFLRQYWKFVRRGAVRIGATSSSGTFDPLAFVNTDGKQVAVVKAAASGTFTVQGLVAGTYGIKYTTSAQYNVDLADATIAAGQALTTSIPAAGVLTIYGKSSPASTPGSLQFSAAAYSVNENGGQATVTVTRSGGSSGAVSVSYATSNGTATAGSDYTARSGTLTWTAGDAASKTFTVAVTDDATFEGNESVQLTLTGMPLGTPSTATLTIVDNDAAPTPGALRFSASTYSVNEGGGQATITVARAGGSSGAVSVSYATTNGTATAGSDYGIASGTLSWTAGDGAAKTFTVTITNDAAVESSETVNLGLSGPTGGATLGTPSSAVLTIVDNDSTLPAPTGLFALGLDGRVLLVWNGVAGSASYTVYGGTAPGVSRANYGTRTQNASRPCVQPGLANGTTYYFVVTATNASGEGAESAEVAATPTATGWPIADADGDGYSDGAEAAAGSNPNDVNSKPVDVDGDGMADVWEQLHFGGTSAGPGADPDGDTASNLLESAAGTDPMNPDTDGDSYSDGQELSAGFDPLNPASNPGGGAPPPVAGGGGNGKPCGFGAAGEGNGAGLLALLALMAGILPRRRP